MTLHTKLSYVKSFVRLIGYTLMFFSGNTLVMLAGVTLFAAEAVGIAEEAWPGAYEGTKTE